ncbi:hypothetical protein AaE_013030 [Aphanomyces astaci]|uniref:Tc1-like transposase DDE domain-containing protein n=1 Tax=Aphanomyces astaci TaxID=112090 RepID=A0A6A4ZCJ4_APHAT|nr:hypothetical protein AaE_013030 [Aphanomyces astaci]
MLTAAHKAARLKWAATYVTMDEGWKRVVFSDEKQFNLDGPDGYQKYWHDKRQPKQQRMNRQQGGGSVMIWAAFSWLRKSRIALLQGRQDSETYVYTLSEFLFPFAHLHHGTDFVVQQDNASIHSSHTTKAFLEEHDVSVLPWPAFSPDLNPIENVWACLSRKVYDNGRHQFSSRRDLMRQITLSWNEIEQSYLEKLVTSMTSRCLAVHACHGDKTTY